MAGPVFLIEKIGIIYHLSGKNLQESGKNRAFLPTKKEGAAAAAPRAGPILASGPRLLFCAKHPFIPYHMANNGRVCIHLRRVCFICQRIQAIILPVNALNGQAIILLQ